MGTSPCLPGAGVILHGNQSYPGFPPGLAGRVAVALERVPTRVGHLVGVSLQVNVQAGQVELTRHWKSKLFLSYI